MRINNLIICIALMAISLSCSNSKEDVRHEKMLTKWKFSYSEDDATPEAYNVAFDDSKWQTVSVPHDWAISGDFDKDIDKQVVAIEQNGDKEATEHTGRTGSLPYIGTGWYRTTFKTTEGLERTLIEFQGVMSEPQVYLNGEKVGEWKNGYTPFIIDVTNKVNRTGENILAVKATNIGESSRWYPGAGIYRPVTIIETKATAISEWGINVSAAELLLDDTEAQINVSVDIVGDTTDTEVSFDIVHFDHRIRQDVKFITDSKIYNKAKITIRDPQLWTPENPNLYRLITTLKKNGTITDIKETVIGLRNVAYSANKGFQLNGHSRKIKGVCLHHDLGPLGSAINKAALIRQIRILKDMGCDAIRTAHNIPPTWQMEICDSMGMMVMAESFDEWIYPKCKNGYHRFFNEISDNGQTWAERDLTQLVQCHKNHPSIIMWSIGNEIPEQGDSACGAKYVRKFTDLIHKLDPDEGRIATSGCDRIDAAIWSGFARELDIVGMNYRTHKYQEAYEKTPQKMILGSETASTVSSRGEYMFPVAREDNKMYDNGQCSSYDMEACWWSNIPESDFELQDDKPWVIGEFVWTGFDYLGEPTPYDGYWPSRSSYFGILDLAGLPKDRYYLYRSRWNIEDETLHILPHWSWDDNGQNIPVYCYTSYDEAELFVNGKSQGRKTKDPANINDRYRIKWNDVIYEPGELKVVAYDYDGQQAAQQIINTCDKPYKLTLQADRNEICADGNDLAFITVTAIDQYGTVCPNDCSQLTFEVSGDGSFKGVCNGDATSLENMTKPTMKLFHGQLVVIVQSNHNKGNLTLTVKSKEFATTSIDIKTK